MLSLAPGRYGKPGWEDGRIKSAIGIGTLLEDGIGDTIRVSLTEDPELEIRFAATWYQDMMPAEWLRGEWHTARHRKIALFAFLTIKRRETFAVSNLATGTCRLWWQTSASTINLARNRCGPSVIVMMKFQTNGP